TGVQTCALPIYIHRHAPITPARRPIRHGRARVSSPSPVPNRPSRRGDRRMTMDILGISAYYHDSAACLLRDGTIIAAAQEERFTRKKHDARFPRHAVRYCLREGGVSLPQLRHVVFYDKPLLKFERLLETYLGFSPRGLRSFVAAMPVWL